MLLKFYPSWKGTPFLRSSSLNRSPSSSSTDRLFKPGRNANNKLDGAKTDIHLFSSKWRWMTLSFSKVTGSDVLCRNRRALERRLRLLVRFPMRTVARNVFTGPSFMFAIPIPPYVFCVHLDLAPVWQFPIRQRENVESVWACLLQDALTVRRAVF